jgi:hypothetical protein
MRRNLRGEIERRNLQINSDFLAAFETVKESLDQIHTNVKGMSDTCKSMQVRNPTVRMRAARSKRR